jgi:hypothetical protein
MMTDPDMVKNLVNLGAGSATVIDIDDLAAIDGPRREGAIVKAELRSRKPQPSKQDPSAAPSNQPNAGHQSARGDLLTRAEAALRVLNPKANR